MKPIFLSLIAPAAIFGASLLPVAANAAPLHTFGVEARIQHQQERIDYGVTTGKLTHREAARLERRESEIQRQARFMKFSDGYLSPFERARLERELDGQDFAITRQMHDWQRGF